MQIAALVVAFLAAVLGPLVAFQAAIRVQSRQTDVNRREVQRREDQLWGYVDGTGISHVGIVATVGQLRESAYELRQSTAATARELKGETAKIASVLEDRTVEIAETVKGEMTVTVREELAPLLETVAEHVTADAVAFAHNDERQDMQDESLARIETMLNESPPRKGAGRGQPD